jgi:ABC-type uncharacterized transport system permease subunit
MWFATGLVLTVGGVIGVLFGGFTAVYAGDVEGDEPAIGTGLAIAVAGLGVMALGVWVIKRARRRRSSLPG